MGKYLVTYFYQIMRFLTPSINFSEKYKQKFGLEPEIGSASAYDGVMMLREAIEETQSIDTEKVQEYLNSLKKYEEESGDLIADRKGAFTKNYKK